MELAMLGPSEMTIVAMQIAFLALPLLAWMYLYRKGATARDLIFWGVICILIPIAGPLLAMFYIRRSSKRKRQLTGLDT
ncbi:MAG: hypothetical protein OXE46_12275 [Chloroflexi bacterium]|nr:hypothetical protein [Chloroflexota bacterium]